MSIFDIDVGIVLVAVALVALLWIISEQLASIYRLLGNTLRWQTDYMARQFPAYDALYAYCQATAR